MSLNCPKCGSNNYFAEFGHCLDCRLSTSPSLIKILEEINNKLDQLIAEKGKNEACNMGDREVSDNDPLGNRHDLAADLGDLRGIG